MQKVLLFILLYSALLSIGHTQNSIVGYLPSYRSYNPEQMTFLTDLILFSAEPNADAGLTISPALKKLLKEVSEKKIKGKRYFLCVGGWGRSKHFSAICQNDLKRQQFIKSVQTVLKTYGLDGVDYDWEHPTNKSEKDCLLYTSPSPRD